MRLSKTALEMYKECPRKFQLHYIEGWRSKIQDSPLFFGTAIDEALNCLLLTKKKELKSDELAYLGKDAKELFKEKLTNVKIIKDVVDIRCSELVRYSASDLDLDLIDEADVEEIIKTHTITEIELTKENWKEFVDSCVSIRKSKELLELPEYKLFNYFNWMSLYKKGCLLIDAYEKEILPKIKEVHSIQKIVHLPNAEGDFITGFIDFIATFEDGVKRVMDNKTSSSRYTQKNIEDSLQLSIYTEHEQIFDTGFAVLEKKIRKRDPKVRAELIFGKVSEEQIEKHFQEIDYILSQIKTENFDKNENNCFSYGKPCPFYEICHNNKYDGLVRTKKVEE
jgi:hypothetical protein